MKGGGEKLSYADSTKRLSSEKLKGFFSGWPNPPSTETHLKLLESSDEIVVAIDEETGDVLGFVTALGDGVLSAHITFLEVLPAYRGRGIGQELMRLMLAKLKGLYAVDVVCDPELRPFYERFGMKSTLAMILRDSSQQSGA